MYTREDLGTKLSLESEEFELFGILDSDVEELMADVLNYVDFKLKQMINKSRGRK